MRYSHLLRFCFYFTIVFIAGLISSHDYSKISLWATNQDIQQIFGLSDPASFAKGGWQIYQHGWFDLNTVWLIRPWPPGFMLLQGLILKIFGANAPLVFILHIVAAFFVALFFIFLYLLLKNFITEIFALLLPLLFLLSTQFKMFMLGEDILLGETFAISFFSIGIILLMLASLKNSKAYAINAGIFIALCAYFRPQYEMFFDIGTLIFIFCSGCFYLYNLLRKHKYINQIEIKTLFILISITIATFYIATAPFRIYNLKTIHSTSWVQTSSSYWLFQLRSNKYLESLHGDFVISGGGNVACNIAPEICAQYATKIENNTLPETIARKVDLQIFFTHPVQWIVYKCRLLPLVWNTYFPIENYIFLFMLIVTICMTFYFSTELMLLPLTWMNLTILSGYLVILLFVNFEARYFYFIKFYFTMSLMIYASLLIAKFKENFISESIVRDNINND